MSKEVQILVVEDNPDDAALALREIRREGLAFSSRVVETRPAFLEALAQGSPDIILCDYRLPAFDGMQALAIAREQVPLVPFIIITGSMNEEVAVECMKAGASDYILKDRLSRTGPAVRSALAQAQVRRDKMYAEGALRASEARYRELSVHLEQVREQERAVMAREIHDEFGQALTALKMDAAWIERRLGDAGLAVKVREMSGLIDATITAVQRICAALRPAVLDDFGLEAAVEWQVREFRRHAGIPATLALEYLPGTLDRSRETALFRILQEALTNVARHARALAVAVRLGESGGAVLLEVADDGAGIPETALEDPRAFGLIGMQERARAFGGEARVERRPAGGTLVRARIPLGPEEGEQ